MTSLTLFDGIFRSSNLHARVADWILNTLRGKHLPEHLLIQSTSVRFPIYTATSEKIIYFDIPNGFMAHEQWDWEYICLRK